MKDKSLSNIAIRPAVVDDADVLAVLNRQFNGVEIDSESISDSIKNNETEAVFVAELSGSRVGYACVQLTKSFCSDHMTAELTNLYVEKSGRRNGIGSMLLLHARKYCEENGVGDFFLRVNRTNKGAVSFYESHGLVEAEHLEFRIRYSR